MELSSCTYASISELSHGTHQESSGFQTSRFFLFKARCNFRCNKFGKLREGSGLAVDHQVRVTLGRLDRRMSENVADDFERHAKVDEDLGARMAQVVKSDFRPSGFFSGASESRFLTPRN